VVKTEHIANSVSMAAMLSAVDLQAAILYLLKKFLRHSIQGKAVGVENGLVHNFGSDTLIK
jgi:hypothetical protein